jgi:hypothetical protein
MLSLSKLPRYLVKQHDNFTCELAKVSFGFWKKVNIPIQTFDPNIHPLWNQFFNASSVDLQYEDRYIFIKLKYEKHISHMYFYIYTYRNDIKSIGFVLNYKNNKFTIKDNKIYFNRIKNCIYGSVSYQIDKEQFKYKDFDYHNSIDKIYDKRARILLIGIVKNNRQCIWLKYSKGKLCLIMIGSDDKYKRYVKEI